MPFFAPVTRPAMTMPSITRCGRWLIMKRSLIVPGSLSSALQTMYFTGSDCLRTKSHFMEVGNPAPPIPRSSASFSKASTASQSREPAQHAVFFAIAVGIGRARHARHMRVLGTGMVAVHRQPRQLLHPVRVHVHKNLVIHGHGRSLIAAPQAAHVLHLQVIRTLPRKPAV